MCVYTHVYVRVRKYIFKRVNSSLLWMSYKSKAGHWLNSTIHFLKRII